MDTLAKRQEEQMGITEKKFEVPLLRIILQGFYIACILVLVLLFAKTFYMQVVQGKDFLQMAQQNKFIVSQIRAERGIIYDKDMEQLVFNRSSFDLILQRSKLSKENTDDILGQVATLLDRDKEELKELIEQSSNDQVLIAENMDHQTLVLLESRGIENFPGFSIKNNTIREYLDGETFSHLIGYTGKIRAEELEASSGIYTVLDYVGRSGIESYYEEFLRKNSGKLRIERDALGNVLSQEVVSLPESGDSLVLWLDADLQRKIKEEVEKTLKAIGSKKAVVIAMDPKTGGILSLVSFPGFDNNLFQKGADAGALSSLLTDASGNEPLFNRAISGRYLTGSTIKPLIASAALEEDIISPDKKILCVGQITVPHQYNPEIEYRFTDLHTHGWTDMRKAIAESCNVYFYTIAGGYGNQDGLGPTRIKEYLELFGWGEKTGIDLPGEKAGFLPDKEWKQDVWNEGWWDGDTYNLSIGQGYILITPLEVVNAFSSIANGGTLLKPQVVQKIINSSDGSVVEEMLPQVIRENFISQESLETVREGMRQTVTGENSPQATALDLSYLPVTAAAKTGTAETYKEGYYHSWVTAFAPYEDPEIVLTIMIEDVKGLQRTVTPLAFNILNWYFNQEN